MSVNWGSMTAEEVIKDRASEVFIDCKVNGFGVKKSAAYNLLCSAIQYLKTGTPLVGSRARTLMYNVDEAEGL